MKASSRNHNDRYRLRALQFCLCAGLTIILCSCQALDQRPMPDTGPPPAITHHNPQSDGAAPIVRPTAPSSSVVVTPDGGVRLTSHATPCPPAGSLPGYPASAPAHLPANAWTGAPWQGPGAGSYPSCSPCAGACGPTCSIPGQWRPPGIPGPWPHNEYVCDGGDVPPGVDIMPDWTVRGLDQEDTVAHFDTVDGRTEVEEANRVCLYAPRFAAVRQVSGMLIHETHDRVAAMDLPVRPVLREETDLVTTVNQPVQADRYLGTDGPQMFQEDVRGGSVDAAEGLVGLANRLRPYEDFQLVRDGIFDASEKARLAVALDAAQAWTEKQAVQVSIANVTTTVAVNDSGPQSVYRYELPPGKPRVRVVKLASAKHAQPGDEVEFTIRFDNIGDQTVGNVTIVDNLATRLEYVPDSEECSLKAAFFTQENEGESLVLRWEIDAPLEVGEGGVIRFTCIVR